MIPKSEKYTPNFKGYLTYPMTKDIIDKVFVERRKKSYIIKIKNDKIHTPAIKTDLQKLIIKSGGEINDMYDVQYCSKTMIGEIPILVKKIKKTNSVRIRVTSKDVRGIVKLLDTLKEEIGGIEPTECIIDRLDMVQTR